MNTPQPHPDSPDNCFENDERLFHALQAGHVMDDKVLVGGISLASNSVSCNREKYRPFPEAVLAVKKPEDKYVRVGFLVPGNLPPKASADGKVEWELKLVHAPILDNYSHSEIRAIRVGQSFTPETKINITLKAKMRESLAARMKLIPFNEPRV